MPKVQVLPARVHQRVVHVYQRGSLAAHRDGPLDHLPSLNGHGLNPRAARFDVYDFAMAPHRRVGVRKLRDAVFSGAGFQLEVGHHRVRTPDDVHVERRLVVVVVVGLGERGGELRGAPRFEPEPVEPARVPAASVDSLADRADDGVRAGHQARQDRGEEPRARCLSPHRVNPRAESPTNRASSTQINFFPPGWETRHPGNREPTTRPEPRAYRLRRVGNPRSDRRARDGPPGATEWRRARDVTSTRRAVFSHDSHPGQIFAMTSERTV